MDSKSLLLLTEDHIKAALLADKGVDASLISWEVEHFTNKADNYASVVKFIKVQFSKGNNCFTTSYAVKLSPYKTIEIDKDMTNIEFVKETGFYMDINPKLTKIIKEKGSQPLNVPQCFFSNIQRGKEVMILEDLRQRDFKLYDRTKILDLDHTHLVLKELAKLHASSLLLQMETGNVDLLEVYPIALGQGIQFRDGFSESIYVNTAQKVLQEISGYEKSVDWLKRNKDKCTDLYFEHLQGAFPFDVVCQGDCWSSNFLFRYDSNNKPVEVMILDFQDIRKSSLATELNELIYRSLDGLTRDIHIDSLLATYYEAFKLAFETPTDKVPFSLSDLKQEYEKRLFVGFMKGLSAVPWMVSEEGLQWYDGPPGDAERMEIFLEDMKLKTLKKLNFDPVLRRRYLSIFDDMMRAKVIT